MVVFHPLRHADPTYRRLLDAATKLEAESVAADLRASITQHGVVSTWQRLVRPASVDLGADRGGAGRPPVAAILFRRVVFEELCAVGRPPGRVRPRALLACADEGHESLPLDAVAAALAESGAACVALGARVPPQASTAAVRRLRPAVVVIWSHGRDTADVGQLLPLLTRSPTPYVVAAGPGWDAARPPAPVVQAFDVGAVVAVTLARVRAT